MSALALVTPTSRLPALSCGELSLNGGLALTLNAQRCVCSYYCARVRVRPSVRARVCVRAWQPFVCGRYDATSTVNHV